MSENNQFQIPDITEFRLPFPPTITAREIMSNKKNGKKATKPPNAFMIYRKVFSSEIAKNYRFQQMKISTICSNSWKREPKSVKDHYYELAAEADALFLQSREAESQEYPQLPTSSHLEQQCMNDYLRYFDFCHSPDSIDAEMLQEFQYNFEPIQTFFPDPHNEFFYDNYYNYIQPSDNHFCDFDTMQYSPFYDYPNLLPFFEDQQNFQ
ncbi:hypothetical protein C1645_854094 [Glomus cerebriforme]|uniref:HMG box domain-containing protein n=1 Tax=Glomus cerebriforme TaxID=658196 RepID=A0A397TRL0_9GLOM|nr:hypothetical protein C1645_854094 [Glomus cerebriforme]